MEFLRIFGQNVKKYRELHSLSQEEFAYRLAINFSNISRIESGKQFVSADTLKTIADILCININQLFEMPEEKTDKSKKETYKSKLINYIKTMSEADAQYIFENSKLYMKYKIKNSQ